MRLDVDPSYALCNQLNSSPGHAEFPAQGVVAHTISRQCADSYHISVGQARPPRPLAPWRAFWMGMFAIALAPCKPFRVGMRAIFVAAPQAFRVKARAVSITTGCAFRVLVETVVIATGIFFRIATAPMSVPTSQGFGVKAHTIPVTRSGSPLARRINQVISVCTKEQMRRVYARPIIAMVADKEAVRDRAMGNLVRQAMRGYLLSAIRIIDRAIASIFGARPKPAAVWPSGLVNPSPESLFGGLSHLSSIKGDTRSLGGSCRGNQRIRPRVSYKEKSASRYQFPRQHQYSTSGEGSQA